MTVRRPGHHPAHHAPSEPKHHLAVGSHGPAVKLLEEKLEARGLFHGEADGTFDAKTKAAVERFEHKHHFKKVDGIVGNGIWKRLHLGAAHEAHVGEVTTPTGTASGAAAGTPGTSDTFKTVTLNVKSNPVMSQASVVHDVRRERGQHHRLE